MTLRNLEYYLMFTKFFFIAVYVFYLVTIADAMAPVGFWKCEMTYKECVIKPYYKCRIDPNCAWSFAGMEFEDICNIKKGEMDIYSFKIKTTRFATFEDCMNSDDRNLNNYNNYNDIGMDFDFDFDYY